MAGKVQGHFVLMQPLPGSGQLALQVQLQQVAFHKPVDRRGVFLPDAFGEDLPSDVVDASQGVCRDAHPLFSPPESLCLSARPMASSL